MWGCWRTILIKNVINMKLCSKHELLTSKKNSERAEKNSLRRVINLINMDFLSSIIASYSGKGSYLSTSCFKKERLKVEPVSQPCTASKKTILGRKFFCVSSNDISNITQFIRLVASFRWIGEFL